MADINQPFRITIEHYDSKHSIETNHSDVDIEEVKSLIRSILLSIGFSEMTIDQELFNEYDG